jgi:Putative prokaryotic signal transducing protein
MALVEVGRFFNSFEAGLAKARLEAEGIPGVIFGLEMNPAFAGGVFNIQLMVDDEDLAEARRLLADDA